MIENKELINALNDAKDRNPDAFNILSMVTGMPERDIQAIADGNREATITENMMLGSMM